MRKSRYIAHLPTADESVLLVSLADKVHNVRSLVIEYRQVGDDLWDRFAASRHESLWYYRSLLTVFETTACQHCPVLVSELARSLEELQNLIDGSEP